MSNSLSRRSLFQAAGGLTLLAALPEAYGDTPRPKGSKPLPVFSSLPYLQPGPHASRLIEGEESTVVRWQTDTTPARYTLTYGERGTERTAEVTTTPRGREGRRVTEMHLNHAATLTGLRLATRYRYRLS